MHSVQLLHPPPHPFTPHPHAPNRKGSHKGYLNPPGYFGKLRHAAPPRLLQGSAKSPRPAAGNGSFNNAPNPQDPGDIEDLAMFSQAAAINTSTTSATAAAAPLLQAAEPAEPAESAVLRVAGANGTWTTSAADSAADSGNGLAAAPLLQPAEPAEPAAVLGSQSHAHLNNGTEYTELDKLQSTAHESLASTHASAASSAEGLSPEVVQRECGEATASVYCHESSSSVAEVIETLLEAGQAMDDIERSGPAAEEPSRWGLGFVISLRTALLCG